MARPLRYTLVADGPTDQVLLRIIDWALLAFPALEERGIDAQWADPACLERGSGLKGKVDSALRQYPCDILFVHRDTESSERSIWQERIDEITHAMQEHQVPYVPIVPMRMTEAWLLIDRKAICRAANNPNSTANIKLPPHGNSNG